MKSDKDLLELARKASENAYTPYSKFKVGACVLFESGSYYSGCNVENASYGLTLCAERNALSTAICAGEKSKPVKIAIYSPNSKLCWPCGACRQWIYEFEDGQHTKIILEKDDEETVSYCINELLPNNFKLNMQ